jgi:hypothetical protein
MDHQATWRFLRPPNPHSVSRLVCARLEDATSLRRTGTACLSAGTPQSLACALLARHRRGVPDSKLPHQGSARAQAPSLPVTRAASPWRREHSCAVEAGLCERRTLCAARVMGCLTVGGASRSLRLEGCVRPEAGAGGPCSLVSTHSPQQVAAAGLAAASSRTGHE